MNRYQSLKKRLSVPLKTKKKIILFSSRNKVNADSIVTLLRKMKAGISDEYGEEFKNGYLTAINTLICSLPSRK